MQSKKRDYPAWLHLPGSQLIPCLLTNMDAAAATVALESPLELPDTFAVFVTSDGKVGRICAVTARSPLEYKVTFVGRAPPLDQHHDPPDAFEV